MATTLKAFIPAVLITYLLASIQVTQAALVSVASMGLEVGLDLRLQTILQDLLGMATSYLPLILIAMVLGLPVAAGLARLIPGVRALLFTLAGFTALIALHLIMQAVLGISVIGATRSLSGLLGQGVAGAVGGLCYYMLSTRPAISGPVAGGAR